MVNLAIIEAVPLPLLFVFAYLFKAVVCKSPNNLGALIQTSVSWTLNGACTTEPQASDGMGTASINEKRRIRVCSILEIENQLQRTLISWLVMRAGNMIYKAAASVAGIEGFVEEAANVFNLVTRTLHITLNIFSHPQRAMWNSWKVIFPPK